MQYENALALRLSLETGLRIGDCLSLTPKQLQGQTISYTAQKTGKKGKKKITADLAKRLQKISSKKFIFEGRNGNKPRTRQAVWKDVKKASAIAKIEGNFSPHSARKTYAVEEFHAKGFNEVQKELQHDRAETTMLYAYSDILFRKNGNSEFSTDEVMEVVLETYDIVKKIAKKLKVEV